MSDTEEGVDPLRVVSDLSPAPRSLEGGKGG